MKAAAYSVVIPAYGCEAYIADCIRSVQAQTTAAAEILVIDDCSPDNTAGIVAGMAEADSRIRYIRQEKNGGVAAARNRGAEEAKSEWIAFLDSDDMWLPEKAEKQLGLQETTGVKLIYTGARCMDETGALLDRCFRVPETVDYGMLLCGNDIVCSSVLVKRELLIKYPMERSDLHEDYICWLRILKEGEMAAGLIEPLTLHRLSPSSKSGNKLRSAAMTWGVWKHMGEPFLKRCNYFVRYFIHGMKRYC